MEWTVAIGVDTHKATHTAVALDRLGVQVGSVEIEATSSGYLQLLRFAQALGEPAFALEGAGSYGAGLARFLVAAGLPVYEVERPCRRERRRGKNDLLDAARAAGRLLSGHGLSGLRGGGQAREDLRLLLLERRGALRAHTAALNQLHAIVVTSPAELRERLNGLRGDKLVRRCLRLRAPDERDQTFVSVLRRLARRAAQLTAELAELEQDLEPIVSALAPELLKECGVGPICAAQLVVSSGDPSRMRSEASFAALAGTSPVEASSGPTRRHRLNRGGDRQLNSALHVIARTRSRCHPETHAYYQRLLDRGKSRREALRCVKRTLARHLYRQLVANPALHRDLTT
ncbi:MAG: IS110 family transposase [Actinomycetota bacterium]|nr:IS110 family transposase [Actinomycetota bacterium]